MLAGNVEESVKKYLRRLRIEGVEPAYGVVFGSQAKGTADQWSDIDLVVVSEKYDRKYDHKDLEKLWIIAAQVDSRLEPIACGLQEWDTNDSRSVIEVAHREGLKIAT
jgi:predicted nucleotidyltransferase